MFTIGITGLGAVLAWMRLAWGQWPGVVAHAVINAVGYHLVAPATVEEELTGWFATETGLVGAAVLAVGAYLWLRRAPLRRVGGRTIALGSRTQVGAAVPEMAVGGAARP
jgi:nitrate reductase gamma subunit